MDAKQIWLTPSAHEIAVRCSKKEDRTLRVVVERALALYEKQGGK